MYDTHQFEPNAQDLTTPFSPISSIPATQQQNDIVSLKVFDYCLFNLINYTNLIVYTTYNKR